VRDHLEDVGLLGEDLAGVLNREAGRVLAVGAWDGHAVDGERVVFVVAGVEAEPDL
jgi:hypothetical protein